MPALFHLVLHGLLGSLLAWSFRGAPRAQARVLAWPLFFGLAYAVLVLLPICAYQFRFYPDFSLSYAYDPVLYPWATGEVTLLCLAANLAYVLALVLAYASTRFGLAQNRRLLAAAAPACAILLAAWATVMLAGRNLALGDYASFWRGNTVAWTTTPSGILAALAYLMALLGLRAGERRWRNKDPALFGYL